MTKQFNNSNEEVKNLYKNFLNIGQVGLLDKFDFSGDKIIKAKKCTSIQNQAKKYLT